MANPTKLTVTELKANDAVVKPASGDAIDTNGMVPIVAADLKGAAGRLVIEVVNGATRALTVAIGKGDQPPAVRQSLGDLSVAFAVSESKLIGPLEGARFLQDSGNIEVTFTGTSGAAACAVRTYLLPKA